MNRFLAFIGFVIVLIVVTSLSKYRDLDVKNERFDFDKAKKNYQAKMMEKEELAKERAKLLAPKVEVVAVTDNKPLVELTTPQLVSGSKLYAKCIVCHGKQGQGKKSQNAPHIGGQYDWYIESSIVDMQKGVRENKVMQPYIRKLSAQDVKDLAAYISKLPW